jgi:excisionase family DNA binding protein
MDSAEADRDVRRGDLDYAVSRKDAARLLGIHTDTFDSHVKHGHIRTVKLGKRVLVPASEIRRLLDTR